MEKSRYRKAGGRMLNDTFIKSLKASDKPQKHFDGGGLYLFIPTTGSKLWRLAYRFDKKTKLLSLGEYPAVSLKDARERREEAKKLLAQDIDPGLHRKVLRDARLTEAANTFQAIALEWHENKTTDFTEKHRQLILYRLETYLFPAFGKMAVTKIEAPDILAVARPFEQKGMVETAHRLVQLVGQVLRYAIATGRAKHNVAADLRGALRSRKVTHRATITEPKKIGQLLRSLDGYEGYFPLRCALRLAPLVFVRPTELRAAEWSEINFAEKEWRIQAHRMKMKQQHIVPLSRQALEILEELYARTGDGKYLFPSIRTNDRPISDVTMLAALRRMGYEKHEICTHGFRSMASTLLNELGYNGDWIERQLAHGERNDVRAAYNYAEYLPERRKMMDEWATYLDGLRKKAVTAKK
jgi:integrase